MEFEHLENQLRAEGAFPSPALRDRVLQRCRQEQHNRQRWHRRFDFRLSSAVAGLCLFYWLAIGLLEAQRAALMNPASGGASIVLMADIHHSSPGALEHAIKARSRVLATLIEGDGRNGEEVDYATRNEHDESG